MPKGVYGRTDKHRESLSKAMKGNINGKEIIILKETLIELYEKQKLSIYEIAGILNIGKSTVWTKLKIFGIQRRC